MTFISPEFSRSRAFRSVNNQVSGHPRNRLRDMRAEYVLLTDLSRNGRSRPR